MAQTRSAVFAANRFGLGARPGYASAEADPAGWLLDGLQRFEPRPSVLAGLTAADMVAVAAAARAAQQAAAGDAEAVRTAREQGQRQQQQSYRTAAEARLALATGRGAGQGAGQNDAGFGERLTHFWSNHFAVSAEGQAMVGLAGPFEFEAIRPHIRARFEDMLLAVVRHPGMLTYLDQMQSVGPNSALGKAGARRVLRPVGLNENLGREVLELHTLGVDGGYGQQDVTELARALTGWTFAGPGYGGGRAMLEAAPVGAFRFQPAMHEPGERTLLARRYKEDGEGQAVAMLRDLARHPVTARHVCGKLARHFVADVPPPALVAAMARSWERSGGDLVVVYRTMLQSDAAWDAELSKFRTPWEWVVASMRALDLGDGPAGGQTGGPDGRMGGRMARRGLAPVPMLAELGQPVWRPGSPAGYPDVAAHWAAPDALLRRVEAGARLAALAGPLDARAIGPAVTALGAESMQAVERAEGPAQALALLIVSPEMLRR